VILERQLLVFCKRPQLIVEVFETLFYLLHPYLWENTYIPFLPLHLCKVVDAIGGYVIGMSKFHMDYVLDNTNVTGKVIVILDDQIIIEETDSPEG